ncbi:hypothetical protein Xbed_01678 [Xenorhabdus beddingii]|uniref:Uncharacterized protein n=1 Tax=Xenorhabdus beddingii TaxID=40578 RepID=A0A1Y2SMG9_9GAMM|nr:hypothetical protein Xbed_01678 [Xenorhabdus beddingii]
MNAATIFSQIKLSFHKPNFVIQTETIVKLLTPNWVICHFRS